MLEILYLYTYTSVWQYNINADYVQDFLLFDTRDYTKCIFQSVILASLFQLWLSLCFSRYDWQNSFFEKSILKNMVLIGF